MKPYTIIVRMKNSDVIIYDGWAKNMVQTREIISDLYHKNGWIQDVEKIIIHPNRIRKLPGFYQIRQIAGARQEAVQHE